MKRPSLSLFALGMGLLGLAAPVTNAERLPSLPILAGDLHPAGFTAGLTNLERDRYRLLVVGAAVPGARAARCQARVFDAEGALLDQAVLKVAAGSSAQVDFANRSSLSRAADAEVTCDQPFQAYAAAAGPDEPRAVWGEGSGPSGPCKLTLNAQAAGQGVFQAVQGGVIHTPTVGNRIGVVCINIPHDLSLGRLVLEWDVTPGNWNPQFAAGSHNLAWIHRGSYSKNTVGNVNMFGKGRNFIGMNQNVDMNKGVRTGRLRNVDLVTGGAATYHLRYTYDAPARKAFFQIAGPGIKDGTSELPATARDGVLLIPKRNRWSDSSLFVEFGHFGESKPSNGRPAVATFGWRYSNLRLMMVQK